MDEYFPEIWDSSMLASWKSCPKLFELIYLQDWKPQSENVHRHAGKSFAAGVERARRSFFEGGFSAADSIAHGLRALISAYGDFECPSDSAKSLERTAGALEFYFEKYPLEVGLNEPVLLASGKKAIEVNFSEPLPILHPITQEPLIFCGRSDAVLNYAGSPFNTDEKTTTSLGPTWSRQWDLRAQFTGYAWGLGEGGIKVAGTLVRGIAILKTQYNTAEAIIYHPEWQIERWLDETCDYLQDIIRSWKRKKFLHNLGDSCADFGGCTFKQYCASDPEGEYASAHLGTYFVKRRWNPLTREESLTA